jgi:hypothetical protein
MAGSGGATAGSGGGATAGGGGSTPAGGAGGAPAGNGGGAAGAAAGGSGGTAGGAGTGTTGIGGAAGDAGSASAGTTGAAGSSGAGGSATVACGSEGQACCATGPVCGGDLTCLGGASCNCVKDLFDWYVLRSDGRLLFESDPTGTTQTPVLDAATAKPLAENKRAAGGYGYGCSIRGSANEVWCWRETAAANNLGQLGSGTMDTSGPIFRAAPVLVAANQPLTGATELVSNVATNFPAMCAILTGGKVSCWGALAWLTNLGTASNSAYAVPITTDGTTPVAGVSSLSVSQSSACIVVQGATAKEVQCWGHNGTGQLGQGDLTHRRYPSKVLGIDDPRSVAVGGSYYVERSTVCAVDGDGVRCWGYNGNGYTATGKTDAIVYAPAPVLRMDGQTPLTGIATVRGEGFVRLPNLCALTSTLTPFCWGDGFERNYPDVYVAPNIVALGYMNRTPIGSWIVRYLSSDGILHQGSTTRTPNCGPLE